MAQGTVLAELVLSGDRTFRRAIESSGEQMDDAASDAGVLSGTLGFVGQALEDVRGDAVSTAGSLSLLQGRADEAGDEVSSLGRASTTTSFGLSALSGAAGTTGGTFTSLAVSTEGLTLSIGGLTTSLTGLGTVLTVVTGAAVGLVATLTSLAAVVGTVTAGAGALAGAFGAVIGSGLLAFGQERAKQNKERLDQIRDKIQALESLRDETGELTDAQRDQLRQLEDQEQTLDDQTSAMGALEGVMADLRETLTPIIAEFGRQFVPLIEDAIEAIPTLVRNVLEAVGGLGRFREVLRNLGGRAMDAIPQVAAGMMELARRALPVFVDLVGWIGQNGARIFGQMMRTTQRLAPTFTDFADALVRVLPGLARLGTHILNTVVPALTDFVGLLGNVFQSGAQSNGLVDFIRASLSRLVQWIQGPGKQKISAVIDSILNAITKLLGGEEDQSVLQAFIGFVGDLLTGVSNWLDGDGQEQVTSFLRDLFGAVADGLREGEQQFADRLFTPMANIIASLFDSLTAALNSKEGGAFGKALGSLSSAIASTVMDGIIDYVSSNAFVKDIGQLGSALLNSIGKALKSYVEGLKDNPNMLLNFLVPGLGTTVGIAQNAANSVTSRDIGRYPQMVNAPQARGSETIAPGAGQQQTLTVRTYVDNDGNWQSEVEGIADDRITRREERRSDRATREGT